MAPRKKKVEEAPVFDLSQFREEKRYVWREIEREDDKPLRVKMLDVSIRQADEIPWGMGIKLRDSMEAVAQYVVEWDLTAENIATGETVPVPPPSEAGWEVFELIPNLAASAIINWLKIPHFMRIEAEKKQSAALKSTSESPKKTG